MHFNPMNESNIFQKKLDKWLTEVADQCDVYAKETDLDFYVFQSDYPTQPVDLLILGINPGGSGSYTAAIINKRKERNDNSISKRDKTMLAQGVNIYAVDGVGNDVMRGKLKRVFTSDYLTEQLSNSIAANIYYFNTRDVQALGQLSQDVKSYCELKTKELIQILNPKRLICFCTDYNGGIRQLGITDIEVLPYCLKKGQLDGKDVLLMPNPGYYKAYSYENAQNMGCVIEYYLKHGIIKATLQDHRVSIVEPKKKQSVDIELLLNHLDKELSKYGLIRYDKKRYQTLPCGLQLTVTKDELSVRHIDYNGKLNYNDYDYPLTDSIRVVLNNNGFQTTSAVWLGTKSMKDFGDNVDQIVSCLGHILSKVISDLQLLKI